MATISEGAATINATSEVFYNNVQVVNRDLSTAILAVHARREGRPLKALEALSATGLRSIRFFKEVEGLESIVANDLDAKAVENIRANVALNGLTEEQVIPNCGDASVYMTQHKGEFDVVDLDPYGTAAPFLDSAVQAVKDGGLLCVTCTDMRNLAGNQPESCYSHYGSMPLKPKSFAENALRIVLSCIERHASKYKCAIEPVLSLQINFYARVWVRIVRSPKKATQAALNQSMLWLCSGCDAFTLEPLGKKVPLKHGFKVIHSNGPSVERFCSECGSPHQLGGPIYSNAIHDKGFIKEVLEELERPNKHYTEIKRITGMLHCASEELEDVPLYYDMNHLNRIVHCTGYKHIMFKSAIVNAGYRVSGSHCHPGALKTDAPKNIVWDIIRSWVKLHPVRELKEGCPGYRILAKEPEHIADFTIVESLKAETKIPKFFPNPEKDWGPKGKAKLGQKGDAVGLRERARENQGKRGRAKDRSTKPCKRYAMNTCTKGDACAYLHDPNNIEEVADMGATTQ